jgi:hypothetical protein
MQDIKEYLSYDPLTGLFTRLKTSGGSIAGTIVGYKRIDNYILIGHKNRKYLAHRLAWWFVYGEMPDCAIDHINEDPSDNRICNLRLDVNRENYHNITSPQKNNTSGFRGVSWHKLMHKWRSRIRVKNKEYIIGYYDTPELAHAAYLCAKRELHPFWVENK